MAIVGEDLEDYVWEQINTRQKYLGERNKSDSNLIFFNSKTSWVKLASGVSVTEEKLKGMGYDDVGATQLQGMNLAKNHILFNGISSLNSDNTLQQKEGLNEIFPFQSSYDISKNFGIVPMPGLKDVNIKCLNRGSLKKAKIKLRAENYIQLQILDVLYLRLGYTMLLEWGNSTYLKNEAGGSPIQITPAGSTFLETSFFDSSLSNNKSYLNLLPKIEEERKSSDGNYDGFVGKVSNFDWSFNEDGSYDINLELISLGDVIESLKSNVVLDKVTNTFIDQLSSGVSTTSLSNLDNVINSYRNSNSIFSLLYLYKYQNKDPRPDYLNYQTDQGLCINTVSGSESYQGFFTGPSSRQEVSNYFVGDVCSPGTSPTITSTLYTITLTLKLGFNKPGQTKPVLDAYNYKWYTDGSKKFMGYVLFPNPVTITITRTNADSSLRNLNAFINDLRSIPSLPSPNFTLNISGDTNGSKVANLKNNWDDFKNYVLPIFLNEPTTSNEWRDLFFIETSSEKRGLSIPTNNPIPKLTELLATKYNFAPFVLIDRGNSNKIVRDTSTYNTYRYGDADDKKPFGGARFSKFYKNKGSSGEKRNFALGLHGSQNSVNWNYFQTYVAGDRDNRPDQIKGSNTFTAAVTTAGSTVSNPLLDLQNIIYGSTSNKVDVVRLYTKLEGTSTFTYYLRFKHLLDIIKANVLSRVDINNSIYESNPNIVDINTQDNPSIKTGRKRFVSFMNYKPNLGSYDPLTCIVRDTFYPDASDPSSFINHFRPNKGAKKNSKGLEKWNINQNTSNSMNIYLNFDFVGDVLQSNLDKKGNLSIFSFVKGICDGLNKALGGVNNLEPVIEESTNILSIVDSSKNNSKKFDKYEINPFGFTNNNRIGSFVRKIDLKTAITPQYATMVTVGATAGGYVKGTEATAFARWNEGIIDRFKTELLPANKNSSTGTNQLQDAIDIYYNSVKAKTNMSHFGMIEPSKISNAANTNPDTAFKNPTDGEPDGVGEITFSDSLISQNLDTATEYFKAFPAYNLKNGKSDGGNIGFIPFNIGLKMDGISGIKIYNKIQIDTRFLPPNYSDSLNFIVTAVNHSLKDNDWETELKLTLIPKPIPDFASPRSNQIIFNNNPPPTPSPPSSPGTYWLGTESQFKTRTVKSITIHITVANWTARKTVEFVNRKNHPSGPTWNYTNGIHWAIDRTGATFQGIPEDKRSIHGDYWNDNGVGIEINTYGAVKQVGSQWKTKAYNNVIPASEVVDLGFKWEGSQYYQDYTDVEINGLKTLIQDIISRHPQIQNGITGKSVWKYVFGLPSGKPNPGDSASAQDASNYGGYQQNGIFSHTTGGGTHSDPFPSPKLINMLKSLGYVD